MEKAVLFCVFSYLIVQITSSDVSEHNVSVLRVQVNESITLNCSFQNIHGGIIAWYRQSPDSEALSLIVTAHVGPNLFPIYQGHLRLDADILSKTSSLVITRLTKSDSGLYFCGTKIIHSEMEFENPIRIQIEELMRGREDEARSDVEVTEELTLMERVMVFGGVGLAVLVFFLVIVIAGKRIYYHGWQKGWIAAEHAGLTVQKRPAVHDTRQVTTEEAHHEIPSLSNVS